MRGLGAGSWAEAAVYAKPLAARMANSIKRALTVIILGAVDRVDEVDLVDRVHNGCP